MSLPDVQQLEKAGKGYVFSGNRIEVLIGNTGAEKVIGLIQSMQCSDDYGVQPATTIGHIEVQELIPLEANHTITVSMMVLSKDSMYLTHGTDGLRAIPESGESHNDNQALQNDALKARALTFRVRTNAANGHKDLVVYTGVVYSSGTVDVTANRIVVSNATFRATHRTGVFNETQPY